MRGVSVRTAIMSARLPAGDSSDDPMSDPTGLFHDIFKFDRRPLLFKA
jgi:hypothetical protein